MNCSAADEFANLIDPEIFTQCYEGNDRLVPFRNNDYGGLF